MKLNSAFLPSENIFKKPSLLVIVFAACFAFWFVDFWKPYNTARNGTNFVWDIFGYYSYLPATFCNHGSFEWDTGYANHNPIGPLNKHLPKYTYGMSVMYAPFFALGYKIALNQNSPLHGFSEPFATCVHWGSIFYVLLGLFFLRRFLLFYFSEAVVAITLFACLFGSMLFMYTYVQSEMPHGYLFCLFSVFFYLTHQWHAHQKFKYTLGLAFVFGLISLIRVTESYMILFFIFWNVRRWSELKPRAVFLLKNCLHLLVIVVVTALIWSFQLLFYKQHAGSYFYFAYNDERFFWNDPQIVNILFSYRKGWITYTPLVALTFIGFFFVKKEFPISKWTFVCITALMVYVLSCWWDWNYGGCFGAREFCQDIAYLAVPLAFLIDFMWAASGKLIAKGLLTLVTMIFVFSCVCLNIGQTYQYQIMGLIHFDGMTEEVYWKLFRTYQFPEHFNEYYDAHIRQPDFKKMMEGKDRD